MGENQRKYSAQRKFDLWWILSMNRELLRSWWANVRWSITGQRGVRWQDGRQFYSPSPDTVLRKKIGEEFYDLRIFFFFLALHTVDSCPQFVFSAPDNTLKYLSLYVPAVPSILQYNTSGHGTATGTSTQFCNHKEKERKQLSHLILTAIKLHSVPLERARIWERLQSSATLLLYSNQTTHLSCKRE